MPRKSHKKRKHKRMDKKQRNERSGAIARRKRERKRGRPKIEVHTWIDDYLAEESAVDFL